MLLIDTVQDEYILRRGIELLGIDIDSVLGVVSGVNREDNTATVSFFIKKGYKKKRHIRI